MKSLIVLDCIVLLGCDLQWMGAANVGDEGYAANVGDGGSSVCRRPCPTFGMWSPDNFMLWSPDKFGHIDFTNNIKLPDGHLNTLHSYFAIAIIMFYDEDIQAQHKAYYIEFRKKWEACFGCKINDKSLGYHHEMHASGCWKLANYFERNQAGAETSFKGKGEAR